MYFKNLIYNLGVEIHLQYVSICLCGGSHFPVHSFCWTMEAVDLSGLFILCLYSTREKEMSPRLGFLLFHCTDQHIGTFSDSTCKNATNQSQIIQPFKKMDAFKGVAQASRYQWYSELWVELWTSDSCLDLMTCFMDFFKLLKLLLSRRPLSWLLLGFGNWDCSSWWNQVGGGHLLFKSCWGLHTWVWAAQ